MSEPVPSIPSSIDASTPPAADAGYLAARELLLRPPVVQQKTLLLVGTLVLFVAASLRTGGNAFGRSLSSLGIIVAVLFVHETGHFIGMRAFGYRDVRMFFIPFFGAAVAGKSRGIERWKQGVVLLLGPLPGIVVGAALLAFAGSAQSTLIGSIARTLVFVNAFNLLPVAPFDGGQLLQLVLFSRQRYLETAFLLFAGVALFAIGIYDQSWIFGFLGVTVLAGTPFQSRVRSVATQFGAQHPTLTADAESLGDPELRALYVSAREALPPTSRESAKRVASAMDMVLERATQAPPSVRLSSALLLAWALGLGLSFASMPWATRLGLPPANWQIYTYSQAGFSIECPTPPVVARDAAKEGTVLCVRGTKSFVVAWKTAPAIAADPAALLAEGRDRLLARVGGTLEVLEPPRPGETGVLRFSFHSNAMPHGWARLEVDEARQFTLVSSSRDEGSDAQRYLESFHLLR